MDKLIAGNWLVEANERELVVSHDWKGFGRLTLDGAGFTYTGQNIGKCRIDVKTAIDIWLRDVCMANQLPRVWKHTEFVMQSGHLRRAK